jgi:N-methylhydantoinase B
LKAQSLEQIELLYPITIECMELETDSMGAGESIGGAGVRLVVTPHAGEMECITFGDGSANPPHGVLGGRPGSGGGHYIESHADGSRRYISASGHVRVGMDEFYVSVSTGGGGYGDPRARAAERVCADVRDGIVSRQQAYDIYGVVVGDGFNPRLDVAATEARRRELQGQPRALVDPATPAASLESPWTQRDKRAGDVFLNNPLA